MTLNRREVTYAEAYDSLTSGDGSLYRLYVAQHPELDPIDELLPLPEPDPAIEAEPCPICGTARAPGAVCLVCEEDLSWMNG